MFSQFLTEGYFPFTLSLALLFGLLALELVFAFLGGTLLGAGGDMDGPDLGGPDLGGPDLGGPDLGGPGFDAPDIGDMGIDIDSLDIDAADLEVPGFEAPDLDTPDGAGATGGVAAWLGFGKMPALIWLAAILMAFGLSGLALQAFANSLLGRPAPAILVAIPAAVLAVLFARQFGALFARVLPRTETQALSERHLGRRSGVITQGTAARGRPAEVRVIDRYGNTHYLRAEPLRDDAQIPQGTEVVVLRHRLQGGYLLVPLSI